MHPRSAVERAASLSVQQRPSFTIRRPALGVQRRAFSRQVSTVRGSARGAPERLRIHAINHARKGYDLTDVLSPTNPGEHTFQTHAKSGVGDAAVAAKVEVPLESLLG